MCGRKHSEYGRFSLSDYGRFSLSDYGRFNKMLTMLLTNARQSVLHSVPTFLEISLNFLEFVRKNIKNKMLTMLLTNVRQSVLHSVPTFLEISLNLLGS